MFLYGITTDQDVLFIILRSRIDLCDAVLPDHVEVRSETGQPNLVQRPGKEVRGALAAGLDDGALKRLDGYYGPNYRRKEVGVVHAGKGVRADVYILEDSPTLPEGFFFPKGS